MVKLKGPSLAQDAAGGLAKTLIFSKSKGRTYLKRWAKPANPDTQGQKAMRAIMRFLSEEWRNLASADQLLWEPLAAQTRVSPFNAFQTLNLTRWRNGLAPTQVPVADSSGTWGTLLSQTVTPVSRGLTFAGDLATVAERWALLIYWVPSFGAPKEWGRFIHAIQTRTPGLFSWTWRPIPAGTYHLAVSTSRLHGFLWSSQWNYTRVVT